MAKPKLTAAQKNKLKAYAKAAPGAARDAAALDMMTALEGRLTEQYIDAMQAAKTDAQIDAFLATIEEA